MLKLCNSMTRRLRPHEFKDMVNKLQKVKSAARESDQKTEKLIGRLKSNFESSMNNDLDVKDAFDGVFETVSKLCSLAERGKMSAADSQKAIAVLRSIDQVLQVIF